MDKEKDSYIPMIRCPKELEQKVRNWAKKDKRSLTNFVLYCIEKEIESRENK